MPASMMSADTGGKTNVAGSSMAIVAVGPRPGKTPIAVPRKTPIKQYNRLARVAAVCSPNQRWLSNSMVIRPVCGCLALTAEPRTDDRQRNAQTFKKHQNAKDGQSCRHDQRRTPTESRARQSADDDKQR